MSPAGTSGGTARRSSDRGFDDPAETVERFLTALDRGNIPALSACLCRDACFLTQDATAIRGRDRVVALLAQLVASGLRLRSEESHAIPLADFALVSARWETHLPAEPSPLRQNTKATLALARRESRWKLLLIAPWGWP